MVVASVVKLLILSDDKLVLCVGALNGWMLFPTFPSFVFSSLASLADASLAITAVVVAMKAGMIGRGVLALCSLVKLGWVRPSS